MKSVSHTEIIIIAATVVLIIVITSFFLIKPDRSYFGDQRSSQSSQTSEPTSPDLAMGGLPDDSELIAEYQTNVREILKAYNPDSLNFEAGSIAYQQILNKLLELKVPRSHQNIHMQLVLSFEKLSELTKAYVAGDTTVSVKIEEVNDELSELFSQQQWLRD